MKDPQSAAKTVQQAFERVHRESMQNIPILNPRINVQTLGFQYYQERIVGIVITPWLMNAGGVGARVQGLKRFYSLQLARGNKLRLIKVLDGDTILEEKEFAWDVQETYTLKLQFTGSQIRAWVDGVLQFDVKDADKPLLSGGVAFVIEQGHISSQAMTIRPIKT